MEKFNAIHLINEDGEYEIFRQIWATIYTTAPRNIVVEIAQKVIEKWETIPYDIIEDSLEEDRLEPMTEEIEKELEMLGYKVIDYLPFQDITIWNYEMSKKVIK